MRFAQLSNRLASASRPSSLSRLALQRRQRYSQLQITFYCVRFPSLNPAVLSKPGKTRAPWVTHKTTSRCPTSGIGKQQQQLLCDGCLSRLVYQSDQCWPARASRRLGCQRVDVPNTWDRALVWADNERRRRHNRCCRNDSAELWLLTAPLRRGPQHD